jgi:O-antigen/teichoic acid export membrane protein
MNKKILRGGAWALVGRVFAILSGSALSVLLARSLSAHDFGVYSLAASTVIVGSTLGTLGLERVAVRLVADAMARGQSRLVSGIISIILGLGCLGTGVAVGGYWCLQGPLNHSGLGDVSLGAATIAIALWMGTAIFQRILAEIFRGFQRIDLATLFSGVGSNGILVGVFSLLGLGTLWLTHGVTLQRILALSAGVSGVIMLLAALVLALRLKHYTAALDLTDSPPPSVQSILLIALPLLVATLLVTLRIQADVWLLGTLLSTKEVALYAAAQRLTALVIIPLTVVNAVIPPLIAELYAQRKLQEIENTLRTLATLSGVPSILLLVVFVVSGGPLMGWLFGSYYSQGAWVLAILSLGQLVNVWAGSAYQVLAMTGHQKTVMTQAMITCVYAIAAGAWATVHFGLLGMAVASGSALVLQNVLMVLAVHRKVGIWTHCTTNLKALPPQLRFLKRA